MWDGERLMPKNQVYCAEKLRKTLLFDGDRQIGARIENLVAGTSFPIPAAAGIFPNICYFFA